MSKQGFKQHWPPGVGMPARGLSHRQEESQGLPEQRHEWTLGSRPWEPWGFLEQRRVELL